MAEEGQDKLQVGDRIGPYVIVEKIAEGGMGAVFKGLDPTLERYAAIKILHDFIASEPGSEQNFQEEARAIAALRHANIVPLYSIGQDRDLWYFAMAYIEGQTLAAWIEQGHKLDGEWAMWFMSQAVAALDYAARYGIIHLDIKPSNFLVDADNIVMLTDFGLAQRRRHMSEGEKRELMGTPGYASPEHILQGETDIRTDMYCLGATLFHLMTGEFPYFAETAEEVCQMHLDAPFPKEKALAAGVSEGWVALMRRMMEKKRENRFADYGQLAQALADINHFRYGTQGIRLPTESRKRALARNNNKPPEKAYGVIPDSFPPPEDGKFTVKQKFTVAQVNDTLERRGAVLAINCLAESMDELSHNHAGDLSDLLAVMEKLPVFKSTIDELTHFFSRFTDVTLDTNASKLELVGLARAQNLALVCLLMQKRWLPNPPMDWTGLWEHQIASGLFSEMMVDMLDIRPTGLEFAAGLLHDVGKLVFAELYPSLYAGVMLRAIENDWPLYEAEQETFELNHMQMAELWMRKHKINPELARVILFHHHPEELKEEEAAGKEASKFTLLFKHPRGDLRVAAHAVCSANHLVKELGIGFSGCTFLEQIPWQEHPSTKALWDMRRNEHIEFEEFVQFFSKDCRQFPMLSLPRLAAPPAGMAG